MFITGAFMSHSCWDEWIVFFENKGYKTVAPPWPYKNETTETLRQQPNPKIATIRLTHLLDYYTEIIQKLPEKPILIGHSYGGLLTQLLLQKDLAHAGICIHSIPPANLVYFNFSFYRKILNTFGYFNARKKITLLPFKKWQDCFTNQMCFESQKETYELFVIPESQLVIRDIFSAAAKINFKKKHAPLLFLSGSEDHFVSADIQYSNFKKYKNVHSITCYKEFRDNNHLVLKQYNWECIADFIANCLDKIG
ncbi:alpha/beta hydrolase [Flavobacterium sp. 17A]|uniref:Alpha/beta hydrolase n=1 Tax=Flavobacterium potami TaxID=2872310 RepID=A0A9X1KQG6_9FLAO|nr:alpha/beta hydrolase [Flavobacterium potami]